MSPAVISITIVAYFIILFTISYIAGRKADNEGFFVGNRKSAWYIVAFAMIGSTISGVTFVSVPGMVQASSFSYLQMVLGFIVGQIIIAFVLVPLFYRMNLVSIYEYLENRFDARGRGPTLSRMPDIAVSYLRSFPSPIPVERDPYGIYRMALHFPRWSEIIDMDGCSKNILPGSVGCTLHLLYCFQPASEFQRFG